MGEKHNEMYQRGLDQGPVDLAQNGELFINLKNKRKKLTNLSFFDHIDTALKSRKIHRFSPIKVFDFFGNVRSFKHKKETLLL